MTYDDPNQIADDLVQEHGLEDALSVSMEKTASAADNYALSVWREVKMILKERKE